MQYDRNIVGPKSKVGEVLGTILRARPCEVSASEYPTPHLYQLLTKHICSTLNVVSSKIVVNQVESQRCSANLASKYIALAGNVLLLRGKHCGGYDRTKMSAHKSTWSKAQTRKEASSTSVEMCSACKGDTS
jgi:hypothetical protein